MGNVEISPPKQKTFIKEDSRFSLRDIPDAPARQTESGTDATVRYWQTVFPQETSTPTPGLPPSKVLQEINKEWDEDF